MKIERVDSDKIKVRISHDEMMEMNVRPELFATNSKELNTFLMRIMDEISRQTDFEPFFGSVTMEASQDPDGMSIVLTKGVQLPELNDKELEGELRELADVLDRLARESLEEELSLPGKKISGRILRVPKELIKKPCRTQKRRKIKSVRAVREDNPKEFMTYIFNSFEDMCHALHRISEKAALKSELYKLEDRYVIIHPSITLLLDDAAVLMEFASDVKRGLAYEHIREHGKCIVKHEELAEMRKQSANLV